METRLRSGIYALNDLMVSVGGATVRVGSGDLLGDRALPIEYSSTTSLSLPDESTNTSLPLRVFVPQETLAGEEPLTSAARHPLSSAFSVIHARCELRIRSGST